MRRPRWMHEGLRLLKPPERCSLEQHSKDLLIWCLLGGDNQLVSVAYNCILSFSYISLYWKQPSAPLWNHTLYDLMFSKLWIILIISQACLRRFAFTLSHLATLSHCSPTQPSHADGKPYSGIHTTLGWHASWHGQVTQSRSEDRPSHRRQYPLRSSCVRWKYGHVHAPTSKFFSLMHVM